MDKLNDNRCLSNDKYSVKSNSLINSNRLKEVRDKSCVFI